MQIIDGFLNETDYGEIHRLLTSYDFHWNFADFVIFDKQDLEIWQLEHVFYKDNMPSSLFFNLIKTHLINNIPDMATLIRVKANLNPNTGKQLMKDMFHTDFPIDDKDYIKTAIFYLESNNGYTLFENGKKVESVGNRLVIFNKNQRHTGVEATDVKKRIVVNINYV